MGQQRMLCTGDHWTSPGLMLHTYHTIITPVFMLIAAMFKSRADDPRAPKDLDGERLLSRLLQHGHVTIASVQVRFRSQQSSVCKPFTRNPLWCLPGAPGRGIDPSHRRDSQDLMALRGQSMHHPHFHHMYSCTVTFQPILEAVKAAGARKEDRSTGRFIYYLVQLALGDGAAGTPLPIPVSKGEGWCVGDLDPDPNLEFLLRGIVAHNTPPPVLP